jgi:hypothetical protein
MSGLLPHRIALCLPQLLHGACDRALPSRRTSDCQSSRRWGLSYAHVVPTPASQSPRYSSGPHLRSGLPLLRRTNPSRVTIAGKSGTLDMSDAQADTKVPTTPGGRPSTRWRTPPRLRRYQPGGPCSDAATKRSSCRFLAFGGCMSAGGDLQLPPFKVAYADTRIIWSYYHVQHWMNTTPAKYRELTKTKTLNQP